MEFVQAYIDDLRRVIGEIDIAAVVKMRDTLRQARDEERMIFAVGNGGSAALASHFAVDMGKGASLDRPKRFRVLSLTDNVPWMTALCNDISYDDVFVEQMKNYARPGDVLFAVSGSGNSKNVLKAVEYANEIGMTTLGLTGFAGGKLAPLCDQAIVINSNHMGRIEDGHFIIAHILEYYFMENE